MIKGISDRPTQRRLEKAAPSVFEQVSDAVLIADAEGVVRFANAAARTMFAASPDELVGRAIATLFPGWDDYLRRAPHRLEGTGQRTDTTTFPLRLSIGVLDDHEGKQYVVTVTDLSELKHLDARLQSAQTLEAIGLLAGGIAHDFNNLLMIVAGYCDSLRDQSDFSAAHRAALDQIAVAADQASSLTAQLLALSRRTIVEPAVIDLHDALVQTRRLLDRTIGDDITILMDLAPKPVHVRMNRSEVGQILINLAINARDAMPNGGTFAIRTRTVTLDAGRLPGHLPPGEYVELTVSDTGTGMSPETRARAFEPFFTTKTSEQGNGLGLPSVSGIVKQGGGEIRLESSPGAGTVVSILIPLQKPPRVEGTGDDQEDVRPAGSETALVVEDDPAVREIVATMLRDLGYRALEAEGLEEALAALARNPTRIELLVSDLVMPEINGPDLAARLRQELPDLRVLFMSGYDDDGAFSDSSERIEAAFIRKPFTRAALARRVRDVLDADPIAPPSIP